MKLGREPWDAHGGAIQPSSAMKQILHVMPKARKKGPTDLETDDENPSKNDLFAKREYPLWDFVCETLRGQ
jgi:hypothetical protein